MQALAHDAAHAIRMVRQAPWFAAIAVLTMAIGIGATTGMFAVMRTLLLAPPHIEAPDRVFRLHQFFPARNAQDEDSVGDRTAYPFLEMLAARAASLQALAACRQANVAAGTGSSARMARAVMVSAGFWKTLGTRPALGRFIDDREAHPVTGASVVVLGHAYWQRQFGGRADVLGQTLGVRGRPYEIIGVTPRGFRGVEHTDVDLWLPLFANADGAERTAGWHRSKTSYNLAVVMRVKRGVSAEQAAAELTTLQRVYLDEAYARDPSLVERNRRVRVLLGPLTGGLGGDLRPIPEARVTVWLVGVAFALLAIASTNVAGLLLLRAIRRRREVAVRLALGASRKRLALQFITESAMLALLGALAAFVSLLWIGRWLQRTILPSLAWEPQTLFDPQVVVVAALCVLGAALVSGMAPLYYARTDGIAALGEGLLRGPAKHPLLLTALLGIQGALCVVLLVGAGLFVLSMRNAQTVDIGVDRDNVLSVQIDFSGSRRTPHEIAAFFERALERVSTIPGVAQASLAMNVPLRGISARGSFRLPDRPNLPSPPMGGPYVNLVTPEFFATTGMRLLQGRTFTERERQTGDAIIVSEGLARLYWPDRSPIGECVQVGKRGACTTVVGVVADSHTFRIVEQPRYLLYYLPMSPDEEDTRALLVRMALGTDRVDGALRQTLQALDQGLPFLRIETLGEVLNPQIRPWRLGATVFTASGVLAAILAAIGLWSSVAYAVSQRTRELAIRMALGARRASLVARMLGAGVSGAVVATAVGLTIAGLTSRFVADLLYGVSPREPIIFVVAGAAMLVVATAASLLPAWRISRIDPAVTLRAE